MNVKNLLSKTKFIIEHIIKIPSHEIIAKLRPKSLAVIFHHCRLYIQHVLKNINK